MGSCPVSSFDTSKILDVEVLTKYCHTCSTAKVKAKPHFCDKNFKGTSGAMEVEGSRNYLVDLKHHVTYATSITWETETVKVSSLWLSLNPMEKIS